MKQFLERGLIPDEAMARFESAIASAFRLRNSVLAEILLIAVRLCRRHLHRLASYNALDVTTWYAAPEGGGSRPQLAGWWYVYVSLPLFQFMLCAGTSACSSGCASSGRYRASA